MKYKKENENTVAEGVIESELKWLVQASWFCLIAYYSLA